MRILSSSFLLLVLAALSAAGQTAGIQDSKFKIQDSVPAYSPNSVTAVRAPRRLDWKFVTLAGAVEELAEAADVHGAARGERAVGDEALAAAVARWEAREVGR